MKEPVAITDGTGERFVLMSVEEYLRLKTRDRVSFAVEELADELVEQAARTEMDPRHDHLNRLMD